MIDFGEEEQPLFRHRAQCKAKEGEVIVTSLRIMFMGGEAGARKEFAWAAVQGVKYSPPNDPKGRAMVLLKTTVLGDEDIIITLLGSSKEQNFIELENLKGIVSKIRKSKGAPTLSKASGQESMEIGTKRAALSAGDTAELKRRKQLLELDRHLAKQYHDLVEVSRILTDDDFWASYGHHTQQFGDFRPGEFRKGKQNSLLSDALAKATNGVINLTVELKQNIFAMYPEVRRAFEAEVPLKRSEAEFWTVYFQSEYYNAKSSSNTSGQREDTVRDDLFARYTEQTSSSSSAAAGKRKVDAQLMHSDIDLTASFGDYRPPESMDASDVAVNSSAVSAKYNRNSALVLGGPVGSSTAGVSSSAPSAAARLPPASTQLNELLSTAEPEYIRVHVAPSDSSNTQAVSSPAAVTPAPAGSTLAVDYGSLADQLRKIADGPFVLPANSVPAPDRGNRLFLAETARLRKQGARSSGGAGAAAEKSAVSQSGGSAIMGLLGIDDTSAAAAEAAASDDVGGDTELLGEAFKQVIPLMPVFPLVLLVRFFGCVFVQEMLEAFTEATELLRHFYTVLNRVEANSSAGNAAAAKAEAILQRLQEVNAKSLDARKRQISETYKASPDHRDAALAVINNILLLVQRANVTWGMVGSAGST
jgi:hypothetical protein